MKTKKTGKKTDETACFFVYIKNIWIGYPILDVLTIENNILKLFKCYLLVRVLQIDVNLSVNLILPGDAEAAHRINIT